MKFSPQSTHLIVRSGCSAAELVAKSRISSLCDMVSSPGVGLMLLSARPHSAVAVLQRGAADVLASIGVGLALEQAERMSESITMSKLCQGKNR